MPLRRPARLLVTAALLATIAVAQRPVWTVGGVSPDYTDLPAAVLAAPPGSVLQVRPGVYTGFSTSKALRIECTAVTVLAPPGAAYAITVDTMQSPDGFALVGDAQVVAGALGAMRIAHCGGPVIVEGMTMLAGSFQPALEVDDAASVHLARSILAGMPGLSANLCAMVAAENVIGATSGPGALVADSLFESARSIYVGTSSPGLRAFSSDLRLASDGSGSFSVTGAPVGVPIAAIEAFDSTLQWLPARFQLTPANGAPPFLGVNTTEQLDEVPMLNAGPALLGANAAARLTAGTPSIGLIAVSYLLPTPIVLGNIGLYVDPAPALLAVLGIADATGLTFSTTLPSDPALRGEVFCFQGIVFDNDALVFSSAALWLLR